MLDISLDPILFVRGVPTHNFYLILSGEVMVCSGQEGFFLKMGAFNFLGAETLKDKEFVPDFSAKVINHARVLRITH